MVVQSNDAVVVAIETLCSGGPHGVSSSAGFDYAVQRWTRKRVGRTLSLPGFSSQSLPFLHGWTFFAFFQSISVNRLTSKTSLN